MPRRSINCCSRPGVLLGLALVASAQCAWSSDACSTTAVYAAADVRVSDGSSFRTEAYFHAVDVAAIRHIDDGDRIVAVEGSLAWARSGDRAELGGAFHKVFALGHQYHALLLGFDEVFAAPRRTDALEFADSTHAATSADYPYGGVVHLVDGETAERPKAMLFAFPDAPVISAEFLDWQMAGDIELPFLIRIDDGDRVFDYRYTEVDLRPRPPLWYFDSIAAPPIDDIQVFRSQRRRMAAGCPDA